jgi:16S rRNA (cytosine1402-N4)-methyltransferase
VNTRAHTPVMVNEVLAALSPKDGGIYIDGTFGAGGYSRAILEAAQCTVYGIDRDPDVKTQASDLEQQFAGRLSVLTGRFSEMNRLLSHQGVTAVSGVALDLGVSSMQLDQAERGFSFRTDGPLDMRMEKTGPSAADVVNGTPEEDLANIIYKYGEERASRRITRAIVEARQETPFTRTLQLADLIRSVMPRARDGINPATRTFQALRIYVNDELGEIDRGLCSAEDILEPGGNLAVVSFHSLEDRKVKEFLRLRSGTSGKTSRHLPELETDTSAPTFRLLRRRATKPTATEVVDNPRSRSARFRAAERLDAPPWPSNDPSNDRGHISGDRRAA